MVDIPRTHLGNTGQCASRSSAARRWGSVIGGSALAIYGLTRRSPLGVALAAGGGTLAVLGASAKRRNHQRPSAWTSILINCSPQEAYRFWRDFENLPRFMNRLQSVTKLDDRRSRWVALGPGGRPIRWEAEITDERESQYIAWRSLPNSDIQIDGRVEFKEAPAGRGTLVSARLEFHSPAGMSSTVARLFGKGANFAVRQDLRRLEALMEAGEVPTTEGQSHGPRDRVTAAARMIDPTRPMAPGSSFKDVFAAKRRIA